ncbi:MAG: hypothetical protein LLF83_06010 [Methanobacterium sp.]|nr:hypothetical protein [Methanobacterium sp.]
MLSVIVQPAISIFLVISRPLIGLLDIIIAVGNIILLIVLLYIYWGNYKKIKSEFTLGLILFAALLLLQNFLFSSFLLFHEAFRVEAIDLPLFILNITEFLALAILLKVTY